jgi:hypothetical protein
VAAVCLMAGVLVAFASIAVALLVTPMQLVSVVGQSVRVGAADPGRPVGAALSLASTAGTNTSGQRARRKQYRFTRPGASAAPIPVMPSTSRPDWPASVSRASPGMAPGGLRR